MQRNALPVDLTYLELTLFDEWMAIEDRCGGFSPYTRHNSLQYLELYDDPAWNADIIETYCFRRLNWPTPGDFLLRYGMADAQLWNSQCQNEDPAADNYQAPALSPEEMEEWAALIAPLAPECRACGTDADCGEDGVACNGEEYCDEYGYCDVWAVAPCNDGLVCTYDFCGPTGCETAPSLYGDADRDGDVELFDIFCVLDGFNGDFDTCTLPDVDIGNCQPDGAVDLFDILAVLDAFQTIDPCCPQ